MKRVADESQVFLNEIILLNRRWMTPGWKAIAVNNCISRKALIRMEFKITQNSIKYKKCEIRRMLDATGQFQDDNMVLN